MSASRPRPQLGFFTTVGIWALAFVIVVGVAGAAAHFRGVAEDADFADRSGSVELTLTGQMESDRVWVKGATLSTHAKDQMTTMVVHVVSKPDAGNRSPIIRITAPGVTCQTPRSWLWNSGASDLDMACDRHLTKEELEAISTGVVEIGP